MRMQTSGLRSLYCPVERSTSTPQKTLSLTPGHGGLHFDATFPPCRRPSGAAYLRMKQFRLALIVFASAAGLVRAQEGEERRAPPIEIPDFSNLDEYIYEPKSTVRFGYRYVRGAKTSFAGTGRVVAAEDPGPATGANLNRVYHDGAVRPDARAVGRVDSSGNPIIDPATN